MNEQIKDTYTLYVCTDYLKEKQIEPVICSNGELSIWEWDFRTHKKTKILKKYLPLDDTGEYKRVWVWNGDDEDIKGHDGEVGLIYVTNDDPSSKPTEPYKYTWFPKTVSYYEEEILYVIGSSEFNIAENPEMASEIILVQNINGSNTLSFTMYANYYENGEKKMNPYLGSLANEAHLKLKYKDKFFDFSVKTVDQNTEDNTVNFTCEDLYITELGRTGSNLVFNSDLTNNQGTALELGAQIVNGTDWTIDENSDTIRQFTNEAAFKLKLISSSFTAHNMLSTKTVEVLQNDIIYVPYSVISEKKLFFQFIFHKGATSYKPINEDGVLVEDPKADWYGGYYLNVNNFTIDGNTVELTVGANKYEFINTGIEPNFKISRPVKMERTKYDPITQQIVNLYKKNGDGSIHYVYTDTQYKEPNYGTNLALSGTDFTSLTGWEYRPNTGSEIIKIETINEIPYIKLSYFTKSKQDDEENPQLLYNNCVVENNISFTAGEYYVVRYKYVTFQEKKEKYSKELNVRINSIGLNSEENNVVFTKGGHSLKEFDDFLIDANYFELATIDTTIQILGKYQIDFFDKEDFNNQSNQWKFYFSDGTEAASYDPAKTYYTTYFKSNASDYLSGKYEVEQCDINETYSNTYVYFKKINGYCYSIWEVDNEHLPQTNNTYGLFVDSGTDTLGYIREFQFFKIEDKNNWRRPGEYEAAQVIKTNYIYPEPKSSTTLANLKQEVITDSDLAFGYQKMYYENCEKVKSISAAESNRFNLIQDVSESFECWSYINVERDDQGRVKTEEYYRTYPKVFEFGKNYFTKIENTYVPVENIMEENDTYNSSEIYYEIKNDEYSVIIISDDYIAVTLDQSKYSSLKEKSVLIYQLIDSEFVQDGATSTYSETSRYYLTNFDYIRWIDDGKVRSSKNTLYTLAYPSSSEKYYAFLPNRQKKSVTFKESRINDNYAGFKYGINLKGIQRTDDSTEMATKVVVQQNNNQYAENGVCSIAKAKDNQTKQDFIINLDYYVRKGILNKELYEADLQEYYSKLSSLEKDTENLINEKDQYSQIKTNLDWTLIVLNNRITATADAIDDLKETFNTIVLSAFEEYEEKLSTDPVTDAYEYYLKYNNDPTRETTINQIVENTTATATIVAIKNQVEDYKKCISRQSLLLAEQSSNLAKLNSINSQLQNITVKQEKINQEFLNKYSKYIREGTWSSEDYIDSDLYYYDALVVANTSKMPQVTYTINVFDVSVIDGYELYNFEVGDKTYVEDVDFFGYSDVETKTPYKEEVIISEITSNLDNPAENTIVVQNFRTKFENLFSRVAASVASLEYNQGRYNATANNFNTNGTLVDIDKSIKNSLILKNSEAENTTYALTHTINLTDDQILITTTPDKDSDDDGKRFRWDKDGISAYSGSSYTAETGLTRSFTRFDKHGFYGIKNKTYDWNPNTDDGKKGWDKIVRDGSFGLGWESFFFKGNVSETPGSEDAVNTEINSLGIKIQKNKNGESVGKPLFEVTANGINMNVNSLNIQGMSSYDMSIEPYTTKVKEGEIEVTKIVLQAHVFYGGTEILNPERFGSFVWKKWDKTKWEEITTTTASKLIGVEEDTEYSVEFETKS